jgi:hypothetical protein
MQHPEGTTTARIIELAKSFHSTARLPIVDDWNADKLDQWALTASHGERLAAQFLLAVWNQFEEWKCGRFDVIEAYGVWDEEHWRAFQRWAENPFTL